MDKDKKIIILGEVNKNELQPLESSPQQTEEDKEMVVYKAPKPKHKRSFSHIMQSFVHAIRWSQFKRSLGKENLLPLFKRHWYKGSIAVLLLVVLFRFNWGGNSNNNVQHANLTPYTSASNDAQPTENAALDAETQVPLTIPDASAPENGTTKELANMSEYAQTNYIKRFAQVARDEMRKYKIPASVSLGLAILNSEFGTSTLATKGNNHLNITCSTNPLAQGLAGKGTHNKECYTYYHNAWTSFRANSIYLTTGDFKELASVAVDDYTTWASGLEKLGYSGSNFSANALIAIIEKHELYRLDK